LFARAPPAQAAVSETDPDTPRTSKSVTFIPLSPKSSATLRRHHEEQATKSENEDAVSDSEDDPRHRDRDGRRRRNSDPSSDRPLVPSSHRRRSRDKDSATDDDDDEDVIEMLPDRFDAQGRPLDGTSAPGSASRQMHSRRGEFAYRSPRGGADGFNMRGQWGVAGTDAAAVERIVQNVTGVLEGRGSLLGLIGGILSGSLLEPGEGREGVESEGQGRIADRERSREDDDDRRRRRRTDNERGESSRHAEGGSSSSRRARGRERDDYDEYDDGDDRYDGDRKRRRRRRADDDRDDGSWDRGLPRARTWG
jgi:hypothetical protein